MTLHEVPDGSPDSVNVTVCGPKFAVIVPAPLIVAVVDAAPVFVIVIDPVLLLHEEKE